jgi:hypothetical protein
MRSRSRCAYFVQLAEAAPEDAAQSLLSYLFPSAVTTDRSFLSNFFALCECLGKVMQDREKATGASQGASLSHLGCHHFLGNEE